MYPSNHTEPAVFLFHLSEGFQRAAPIAVCKKKKRRARRKSPYMPNMVKKSNVACRSCILFQLPKAPVPGWDSLLLVTEALQSCAWSSSSNCLLLLLVLSGQSCVSAALNTSPSWNAEITPFNNSPGHY